MDNKGSTNNFDIEQIKNKIQEANKTYGGRFVRNDREWYADKYFNDACAMPEKMKSVCGIDSIINYYYNGGKNKDFKIIIKEQEIYGSGDVVIEEGLYDFPDGAGGSFDRGKFIAIWKLDNTTWKIYREIWNSNVAEKEN